MISLAWNRKKDPPRKILCLGAHCDDIEIGCGGTILKWIEQCRGLEIFWVVFSSDARRGEEARKCAASFLNGSKEKTIVIRNFRDGYFPYNGSKIKDAFERLKRRFDPDLVFTHYRHDLHQDHRLISELTWNTFRNHFVLEYEIPKYDGDFSAPNAFIHLDEATAAKKIDFIMNAYKSQNHRKWFTKDLLLSTLRIRGMESNAPENYSEAFYSRKVVLE